MGVIVIFKQKYKIFIAIFIIFTLLSVFLAYFSGIVKPILLRHITAHMSEYIENVITDAITDASNQGLYVSPINYAYDGEGRIAAYSADMLTASKLRAVLSKSILDKKSQSIKLSLDIALGTLSGIPFLYGKGPEINIRVTSLNFVSFNISSEFTDSGINQTLHRIILNVEANIMVEEPIHAPKIEIRTSLPLSETIIVGDVPDAYTVIIRANEDDEEDINDYGAGK